MKYFLCNILEISISFFILVFSVLSIVTTVYVIAYDETKTKECYRVILEESL